jgi:amino acid transporter
MKKLFISLLLILLFLPLLVLAQEGQNDNTNNQTGVNNNTPTTGIVTLDNPLSGIESPQALVGQVINSIFGIVGSLALVMFIYGGFLWLTSAGSAEQVKKGKDIFIWAVIGLVVIFSAYSLVRFVIQGVGA